MTWPQHTVKSEFAYGLFALDTQRRRFSETQFPRMRRVAAEIAHVLYAQRVERRLLSVEPYELLGRVQIEGRRGDVMVTNRVLFAGTTFNVCLPIAKTQESVR